MPTLEVTNLRKSIGGQTILAGAGLTVAGGEAVGLFGRSGSGKSTLFNLILGVSSPDAGSVFLNGRNLDGLPPDARARLGLGYVPQKPFIPPQLSVADALTMAAEGAAVGDRETAVEEAMAAVDIAPLGGRSVGRLSGGERRRAEVAYVLATRPSFLLLDEPFAGLDPIAIQVLNARLARVVAKGMGVLVAEHNHIDARKLTSRFYILRGGTLLSGEEVVRQRRRRRKMAAVS